MSAARDLKAKQIEDIKAKIQNCSAMVLVDYKGVTVAEDTVLRAKFRAENVEYKVLKNRLVQKAFAELGIQGFDAHLEGPTAFAFANGDALAPAKIIKDACKSCKALEVKCGLMDGAFVDSTVVDKLASIPSKEVLLAQLLGMLQSPMSGLARALQQVAEKNA